MTVNRIDAPVIIAEKLESVIKDKEETGRRGVAYVAALNQKADKAFDRFHKRLRNLNKFVPRNGSEIVPCLNYTTSLYCLNLKLTGIRKLSVMWNGQQLKNTYRMAQAF